MNVGGEEAGWNQANIGFLKVPNSQEFSNEFKTRGSKQTCRRNLICGTYNKPVYSILM